MGKTLIPLARELEFSSFNNYQIKVLESYVGLAIHLSFARAGREIIRIIRCGISKSTSYRCFRDISRTRIYYMLNMWTGLPLSAARFNLFGVITQLPVKINTAIARIEVVNNILVFVFKPPMKSYSLRIHKPDAELMQDRCGLY